MVGVAMKKRKVSKYIFIGISIICAAVFIYAAARVYSTLKEHNAGKKYYETLASDCVSYAPTAPTENTEETDSDSKSAVSSDYSAPVSVAFDKLPNNENSVAWIYEENTPINYPVAQGKDNYEYLDKLLDGTYNFSGTVFLDYRNSADFSDFNSILYGHNMNNGTMFGTIVNYKEQSYYDAHPVLFLSAKNCDYKIELIGGCVTKPDSEFYAIPQSVKERDLLIDSLLDASTFSANPQINENDRLITLSTCSYEFDDARYVLVGKLVKL